MRLKILNGKYYIISRGRREENISFSKWGLIEFEALLYPSSSVLDLEGIKGVRSRVQITSILYK